MTKCRRQKLGVVGNKLFATTCRCIYVGVKTWTQINVVTYVFAATCGRYKWKRN